MKKLNADIQAVEYDMDAGMLSPEENAELTALKGKEPVLAGEIQALEIQAEQADNQVTAVSLEDAQKQISEKKELITAVSFYISKRVELVLKKLKMNRVDIQLYEVVKTTGETRDVFKFTYDGRPYVSLSTSEQIRAGLEVSELMKTLAGRNYPVFIDNGESVPVIDNIRPTGQVFLSQVVKGAKLDVRILDAPAANKAA